MTTEEKLDRLAEVVNTLASSIVSHDDQLEALLRIAEEHSAQIALNSGQIAQIAQNSGQIAAAIAADERLRLRIEAIAEVTNANSEQIAATERRWQADLTTLSRQ